MQETAFQRWPGEGRRARGTGQAAWPQRSASPCTHRPEPLPEQPRAQVQTKCQFQLLCSGDFMAVQLTPSPGSLSPRQVCAGQPVTEQRDGKSPLQLQEWPRTVSGPAPL